MSGVTEQARLLRAAVAENRSELVRVLTRYGASNPRVFGSVARGDARPGSDLDVLVDLDPGAGNELLRIAGIGEEFRQILRVDVDVVSDSLLRGAVSASAHREAVRLCLEQSRSASPTFSPRSTVASNIGRSFWILTSELAEALE
ncbi:MAG: nucleotidyltransferase domain-containing protein [Bifidobacteriaceae bacterium]|jgi:predicted nucleotidyltransferase|nr:nucleotidyltransferase domain-containing protein [Bifidobacteriaceae bacterium]